MHRCPTFVSAAHLPSTSRPPFVRVAEPRGYALLSYIRKRCSSAVYIADLRSYALQNLVGTHRCPTFVSAARLPSTSLTYVRTRRTSALYIVTYARTRCRTSLVFTAVLHSYALLVCRQHRRPPFVCIAEPRWYASLSYIRKRCSTAVYIADLHSYALHVYRLHRDLRSYASQNLVVIHRCPTFVRAARLPSTSRPPFVRVAEPRWYAPLSYIRKRCSSAVYIATSVRTRCRTSLVCTAVLHS